MESKFISEDILRLHMVHESEKLLSEIKHGEVGKNFFLINVAVRIYRYISASDYGHRTLIYENKGFKVDCFTRWKWFFRYLQAIEQVKTPKQLVQIETISYVNPDRNNVLLKALHNKLTAAKRDRTKIQMSIENAIQIHESTALFPYQEDPGYGRSIEYLSKKEKLISDLEAEIDNLKAELEK